LAAFLQLIIVGVLYFIIACVIGLTLILIARLIMLLKKKVDISVNQLFWFPLKLLPYFLLVIIVNVLICEFVRDVDPPLTDYWSMPIKGELTMGAIDTLDNWSLWSNRNGGEAIISNIVLAGISDKAFYGSTYTNEYFIYHLELNQKTVNLSKPEFEIEIKKIENVIPVLSLPSDIYYDNRDLGDLITFILVLLYPLYRFYHICMSFWRLVSHQ